MSKFVWNLGGRIAYGRERDDVEEYNGWWRHVAFGLFVFIRKARPGWST